MGCLTPTEMHYDRELNSQTVLPMIGLHMLCISMRLIKKYISRGMIDDASAEFGRLENPDKNTEHQSHIMIPSLPMEHGRRSLHTS